jgi:hypothetical protein
MRAHSERLGFSAEVRMELSVNGHVLSVGQLGPDFLILDSPTSHPPSKAEVAVWIDGDESRWTVHLPDGISPKMERTRIAPCER